MKIEIQAFEETIDQLREEIEKSPDNLIIHSEQYLTPYGIISHHIVFRTEDYGDEEISHLFGVFLEKTGMVVKLGESSYEMWQDIYLGLPQLKEKKLEDVPYFSRLTSDEKDFIKN